MLRDSAPPPLERRNLQMMTDSEKQTMRDSVRGMPLSQAAALPLYDNVRGLITSSMPAERYYAILDGATADTTQTPDQIRSQAAYDHMVQGLNDAHRSATNDNKADHRQFARDGRTMSTLSDREKVDEAYRDYADGLNAWRDK
jgi:hypothetical protein